MVKIFNIKLSLSFYFDPAVVSAAFMISIKRSLFRMLFCFVFFTQNYPVNAINVGIKNTKMSTVLTIRLTCFGLNVNALNPFF